MVDRANEPPAKGDTDGICPECRGSGELDGTPARVATAPANWSRGLASKVAADFAA